MNKYIYSVAVLLLWVVPTALTQEYNESSSVFVPLSEGAEIPESPSGSVFLDPEIIPMASPSDKELTPEQNREAVKQQSKESLLYGIAAGGVGQSANPNLIYRTGEQISREEPSEGNPDLLYGVGAASQEKDTPKQGSYSYTRDGKIVGRSVTTGDTTRIYGAEGREAGRIQESGGATRVYGPDGRVSGRVQESGGTRMIYDADGRTVGRIQNSGNSTLIYDSHGKNIGRTQVSGSVTSTYDNSGRSVGRVVKQGNTTTYYGSDGRITGKEVIRGNTIYYYDANGRQTGIARK